MAAPEYTECVDRAAYEDPGFGPEIFVAVAGLVFAITTFGVSLVFSLVAAMSALMKVCEYILYRKLVCLEHDQCAVGRVASFETVDDKSGVDKIDNDFSINLLLAPHDLGSFTNGTENTNYLVVKNDITSWGFGDLPGKLIAEQPDMPVPREPRTDPIQWKWECWSGDDAGAGGLASEADAKQAAAQHKAAKPQNNSHLVQVFQEQAHTGKYNPTNRIFPYSNYVAWEDPPSAWGGHPFIVPLLHCEIEGERANAVCKTLAAMTSPIPGWGKVCRWKPFGIPIGRWACAVVAAILAPFVLTALGIAWAAGSDDNRSFENAGSLARGDAVILRGRWCYDAGHSGYNEIHPVRSLQKIDNPAALDGPSFKDAVAIWCRLTAEVPPGATGEVATGLTTPADKPEGMTPEQEKVWEGQQRPENQWVFHPSVDGCEPEEETGKP